MPTEHNKFKVMRGDTWPFRIKFSDKLTFYDGVCATSAPTKITSATAAFTSANLEQKITLAGAGPDGGLYEGKIAAVDSSTQVTVSPVIQTAVTASELTVNKAVNITGNLLIFTLKTSNTAADVASSASGCQEKVTAAAGADSTAGIGRIPVPIAKTALINPAVYYYDIQRVISGSPATVQTPVYGTIEVLEDTTIAVA